MVDGILIVNKEKGKTSFDVVREARKEYNTKKVGHIGTLDPLATGVLPVLIGKATKLSDFLMLHDKRYSAILKLGEKRSTGDKEGEVVENKDVPGLKVDEIREIIEKCFIGEIEQVPPMYSAIKVNGKKLYEYAREGKRVEVKPRKVTIYKIENINYDDVNHEIAFDVECSKGTYIRTLCEDIADKLGTVGYMKSLVRTRVGDFSLEDAGNFIELENILDVPKVSLRENELDKFLNGVMLNINEIDGFVNVYVDDNFIGIGEVKNNFLKRKIVK